MISAAGLQVVSFRLDREEYGIDIAHVLEINRMATVTHVPGAPPYFEGVLNLRGQLIPIVDLRTRLGMPRAEQTAHTRIVVSEIASTRIGLVVDAVSEVIRIAAEHIEANVHLVTGREPDLICGVGKHGDRLIILLDVSRIVTPTAGFGGPDQDTA